MNCPSTNTSSYPQTLHVAWLLQQTINQSGCTPAPPGEIRLVMNKTRMPATFSSSPGSRGCTSVGADIPLSL